MDNSWITACFICGEQHAYWECPRMRRTNMKDTTEIVVVLDKSASMGSRAADTITSFNKFLEEQKAEKGEANLTLVLFDTTYSIPVSGKAIAKVNPLNSDTYWPGGNTALNDALARAIIETGHRLEREAETDRPEKVICVVITDGEENSSKEHTKEQVAEMVKHQQEKYDWAFIFLGANVDAFEQAAHLGIRRQFAVNYCASTPKGVHDAHEATSRAVSNYRSGGTQGLARSKWKDKITPP